MEKFVMYVGHGGMIQFDMAIAGLYLEQEYVHVYEPKHSQYRYVCSIGTKHSTIKAYFNFTKGRIYIKNGSKTIKVIKRKKIITDNICHEEYENIDINVIKKTMRYNKPFNSGVTILNPIDKPYIHEGYH